MFFYPEFINHEKVLSRRNGLNADMKMDITVFQMKAGEQKEFFSQNEETAILLLCGEITFFYEEQEVTVSRADVFSELPSCLHVPFFTKVGVRADKDCEIIVQCADNERRFQSKLYRPADCRTFTSCEGRWDNTARRQVIDIFNYENAPYSNMVLGEVIAEQGRWWSYIPHHHPQPEVYYYKFERPEGFGACFIGDVAHTVKDGSCGCFPGGFNHPQVTAPGFPMYCCWMIRHLPNDPWTDRIDDPRYSWLWNA